MCDRKALPYWIPIINKLNNEKYLCKPKAISPTSLSILSLERERESRKQKDLLHSFYIHPSLIHEDQEEATPSPSPLPPSNLKFLSPICTTKQNRRRERKIAPRWGSKCKPWSTSWVEEHWSKPIRSTCFASMLYFYYTLDPLPLLSIWVVDISYIDLASSLLGAMLVSHHQEISWLNSFNFIFLFCFLFWRFWRKEKILLPPHHPRHWMPKCIIMRGW